MPKLRSLLIAFLCLLVFLGVFAAYHLYSDVAVTSEEVFREDEAEQSRRAAQNFIDVIEKTRSTYAARGAHAKGHACVKAYFEIEQSLSEDLQHGVFSQPGYVFKSWVRFSNGASNLALSHDAKKDSRGMAIKLLNIEKANLKDYAERGVKQQDFLLHNNPVFFSANIEDYNQLVESDNKILSFFNSPNPFKWRLRELMHVFDTLAAPPFSPLWDDYFSNTAYKLGPHNIKFNTQSCSAAPAELNPDQDNPDFLRQTMREELASSEACFRFQVQLQDVQKYMPIEDPSIEWKQADSPYQLVATIRIPRQEIDGEEQKQFCEDLSFSPWHALSAHRPIGQLNRIRKQVYAASSKFRHRSNGTRVPDSLDW